MASRNPGRPAITPRQRLGNRLRTLRELAGIRNEDMAAELKVSPATVSRMESGDRLIRLPEIEVWARITKASAAARQELAELAESAASQLSPWRSRLDHGRDLAQQQTAELEASAATILVYDHGLVPGLLQVREYARLVFEMADVGTKDIDRKVTARTQRQGILLDQAKQFTLLMTEAALYWRPGSVELQVEQMRRISAMMALPNLEIGILPLRGQAKAIYPEGFQIYADRADDADTLVKIELVTDEVTQSDPDSVALYLREFDRLRTSARYDDTARTLINNVIDALMS
jgi:transcriptional regulator with XRE-family HTH domain